MFFKGNYEDFLVNLGVRISKIAMALRADIIVVNQLYSDITLLRPLPNYM